MGGRFFLKVMGVKDSGEAGAASKQRWRANTRAERCVEGVTKIRVPLRAGPQGRGKFGGTRELKLRFLFSLLGTSGSPETIDN